MLLRQNASDQSKKEPVSFWSIFLTFVRIGAFTFGGGHAMLPLIRRDIVEKKGWVTEEEFIDLFAIAQSLPGVFAVNISMFLGFRLRKTMGAIVAATGATLPSFLIILLLALFFEQVKSNPVVASVMNGIRPAVVAMIAIPIISIWRALHLKPVMLVVPATVAIIVWYFSFSPVWVVFIAGITGILYFYFYGKKLQGRNREKR